MRPGDIKSADLTSLRRLKWTESNEKFTVSGGEASAADCTDKVHAEYSVSRVCRNPPTMTMQSLALPNRVECLVPNRVECLTP